MTDITIRTGTDTPSKQEIANIIRIGAIIAMAHPGCDSANFTRSIHRVVFPGNCTFFSKVVPALAVEHTALGVAGNAWVGTVRLTLCTTPDDDMAKALAENFTARGKDVRVYSTPTRDGRTALRIVSRNNELHMSDVMSALMYIDSTRTLMLDHPDIVTGMRIVIEI